MPDQWYCSREGKQIGPMSVEQLRQAAASGKLQPADMVWKDGMAEWTPAQNVKDLFPPAGAQNPYLAPSLAAGSQAPANELGAFAWYLQVLKQYAVFAGRARRKEYWYFVLFNLLISIGLSVIDVLIIGAGKPGSFGLLSNLYSLAVLVPSLAVSVRRLHDTGRSGWWLLIAFLPLIGAVVLLVFMCEDSKPGENAYGPNPKPLM